jgi:hypothetical protein
MTAHPAQSVYEACTNQIMDLDTVLRHYIADPTASWGLGTFGAVAEFHRTSEEPASMIDTDATLHVVTARGALRICMSEDVRAYAYELPATGDRWHHVFALCLPVTRAAMHRRETVTECGPDGASLRPGDRDAILFDLGLGTTQVDVCVRTADPEALVQLRAGCGRALFAPENPLALAMARLSPHRVFLCRFARLEVYQRIPGREEQPPEGPHTHVLPTLLRQQRTHPATALIPAGWVPCLSLYPANPVSDALGQPRPFDHAAYTAFQALLHSFGDPTLVRLKAAVTAAVRAGAAPAGFALPASRAARATVRVALRQLAHTNGAGPALAAWRQAFDRREAPAA